MFDLLYPKLHNEKFPYVADDNLGIGAVYHIPKTEFENVIMEYFNIDSDKLQKKTIYDYQTQTYEYKPRGFYEIEYADRYLMVEYSMYQITLFQRKKITTLHGIRHA